MEISFEYEQDHVYVQHADTPCKQINSVKIGNFNPFPFSPPQL